MEKKIRREIKLWFSSFGWSKMYSETGLSSLILDWIRLD